MQNQLVLNYCNRIAEPKMFKLISDSMLEERMMRSKLLYDWLNIDNNDDLRMVVRAELSKELNQHRQYEIKSFEDWKDQLSPDRISYGMFVVDGQLTIKVFHNVDELKDYSFMYMIGKSIARLI